MAEKISKIIVALFAILVGLYPAIYFILDRSFGLLSTKSNELLANVYWNFTFYTHIILGGIALLIGWLGFSTKIRLNNLSLHRTAGKVYISTALISALAGIGLALFATGGWIPSAGFFCLGVLWFTTTLFAYQKIRKLEIESHRGLMIYSYSICFAAVTLRIWLPLLIMWTGDFMIAYSIVAWLCWVPNLVVAYIIVRNLKPYLLPQSHKGAKVREGIPS